MRIPARAARDLLFSEESTHTVNRPLRVPGQRVILSDAPPPISERFGRSGQVLPRIHVREAEPFEIDVARFDPPPAPSKNVEPDEAAVRRAEEERRVAERAAELEAARREGQAAGHDAAMAELQDEFTRKAARLLDDARVLHEENVRFLERAEVLLVDLAFRIAETVLDSSVAASARDAARDAVANAIERLAGNHGVLVRLHPVDFLHLQEAGLVDQMSAAYGGLRWEPDTEIAPGEWSVESPDAVIRRLESEILSDLRERLGLLTGDLPDDESDAA